MGKETKRMREDGRKDNRNRQKDGGNEWFSMGKRMEERSSFHSKIKGNERENE